VPEESKQAFGELSLNEETEGDLIIGNNCNAAFPNHTFDRSKKVFCHTTQWLDKRWRQPSKAHNQEHERMTHNVESMPRKMINKYRDLARDTIDDLDYNEMITKCRS
jgi:hypothetical protein